MQRTPTPICDSSLTRQAVILLAVLVTGCAGGPESDGSRDIAHNVRVMTLQTRPITEFLELAGPLLPIRGTDLGSEEAGTVVAVDHDKGSHVPSGAPIITLDRRLFAAELHTAGANLELMQYSHTQIEKLHETGKVSRLELLQSAAQLAQARAQLDMARTRHERASVKAPFAGLVVARHVEPGQIVLPGAPVARIVDPYVLKIGGSLTDQEVAWVREGMPAVVAISTAAQPVEGIVGWVGFEAERQTGKFPVEIHVANPDREHRVGVIARARLTKRTTEGMVVIPRDAILPGERLSFVFVVEGDRARKRQIELGPDQGLMVAVARGLAPAELLVVRGQRALRDGGLVAVTERATYGDGTIEDDPEAIRAASAGPRISGEVPR